MNNMDFEQWKAEFLGETISTFDYDEDSFSRGAIKKLYEQGLTPHDAFKLIDQEVDKMWEDDSYYSPYFYEDSND